jgi:hypothetical protein
MVCRSTDNGFDYAINLTSHSCLTPDQASFTSSRLTTLDVLNYGADFLFVKLFFQLFFTLAGFRYKRPSRVAFE